MRFKVRLEDFVVEELAELPLKPRGDFAIYRVEKRDVTTLQVQIRIAAQLQRRLADVQTPALKDKKAIATQYLYIKGSGPAELAGPGYHARFVGRSQRPLRPSDLKGNRFTITLRDLTPAETKTIQRRLSEVTCHGLPNYYDEQRFGSYSPEPDAPDYFIGKTILRRDAEGAVRAYLTHRFVGDRARVCTFKALAKQHWSEWAYLLTKAPRPSNYRSLLTFLKDHPQSYRKALNLVPRRLLSLYLVAYQSYLWNQIAGSYLAHWLDSDASTKGRFRVLSIVDLSLPIYHKLSVQQQATLGALAIPLPGHRAVYKDPVLAGIVRDVLEAEGFQLNDLKARILKRAYLPKGVRPLLLHPAAVTSDAPRGDDHFPGRQAISTSFTLPSGAYATLVLKALGTVDGG